VQDVSQGPPPHFWNYRWSQAFFLGFLVVILLLIAVDQFFADFEYIRVVDSWVVAVYGLFWLLLYRARPNLFRD
jgi:hypothetical protein